MLAPIVLFVYNRFKHTKLTVEALARNCLAKDSALYIFSDGPKIQSEDQDILQIREYIKSIGDKNWFKNVIITEQEKNRGLANSVIEGVSKVIAQFGSVIVVEDDIVTSPYFLSYMNQALDYYADNPQIWSISGYTFPMKSLKKYDKDVCLSYRACRWGWGTWRDRWESIDWDIPDYQEFRANKMEVRRFERGGRDLSSMLESQRQGLTDSWAIRWCYWQSKRDALTIYPRISLVKNIGYDGSGTHEGNEDVFGNFVIEDQRRSYQLSGIKLNNKIINEFYETYSATLGFRIKKKIRKILGREKRFL